MVRERTGRVFEEQVRFRLLSLGFLLQGGASGRGQAFVDIELTGVYTVAELFICQQTVFHNQMVHPVLIMPIWSTSHCAILILALPIDSINE